MTIQLDLNDLTQAHIVRCAPHVGKCRYDAPCIIGTLSDDLTRYDDHKLLDGTIEDLAARGKVKFAKPHQKQEAIKLQLAFDARDHTTLRQLLAKRGLVWPVGYE